MAESERNLLTTGEAARLCSVKPDTVLKWIKKGQLGCVRTPGGHHRIRRKDLESSIASRRPAETPAGGSLECQARALHCWEYLSDRGEVRDDCRQCVVYRVRAARCFLMAGLEPDVGHARQFCRNSCEDCGYYRRMNGLAANVLLITSDDELVNALSGEKHESVTLRFARNAYAASAIIHDFRPAFVLLDVERIQAEDSRLLDSLASDPRVPGLKVILVVPEGTRDREYEWSHHDLVVDVLEKSPTIRDIAAMIESFPVDFLMPEDGHVQATARKGRAMNDEQTLEAESSFDEDGFLKTVSKWNREMAEKLAEKNDIGPLTEEHWKVIEFVKDYYANYGSGPPVVKIGKTTGMSAGEICKLFPCGVVRGAYRLAGLPRPPGCF